MTSMPILPTGSTAPDFELHGHLHGATVSLSETLEDGNVLLVFYPGDFAPT